MKSILFKSLALVVVSIFASCEKVIEVPLNEANREIVVEAVGRNFTGESYVILSKSGSVYDDGGFEKLTDAIVTVTNQDNVETIFTHDPTNPGTYLAPSFNVMPNDSYQLNVNVDGEVLTASTLTRTKPQLDSLTTILIPPGFGSEDTTFLLFYNFVDQAAETNFYRIKAWVNGVPDNNYYLADDKLGNGQVVSAPLFGTTIESDDEVHVELQSMDEDTYLYLTTLSSNLSSGAFGATAANPVTNIDDAIGYFGAYMVDTMSIVIP